MMNENKNVAEVNMGFFEIKFEQDGIYLIVYPPVGKGEKVESRDVMNKLNKKQIRNFDKEAIEVAIQKSDKSPVKIAEPQDEVKVNANVTVTTSPDKMKASITLTPPDGGRMLTYDEIMKMLESQGVVYGIDTATLKDLTQYPVYSQSISIAQGTEPVNGQNGKVEFFFDIQKDRKPTILEDGRVDFRELNLIESVTVGQKLCRLVPPVAGQNGKTVCGVDVPALHGKPALLPKGRNVETSEDGETLVATIDGQVNYIDRKVSVFANYEVAADVDNSTGNINFIGNVIVRGNVLSGFVVEARGNVEVWGVVEGAVIKAGGDIILRRGMQGLGKGVLQSGGDIIARYIEHSHIEAKNNIKSEAIMHSEIKCGNKLELTGRKGLLVGGICKVGKEIATKVIGSPMGATTELEVGLDPNLRERYKVLKNEIIQSETDINKAEQAVAILKKLEAVGKLPQDKQEILAKSVRTKIYLSNKLNEMKEELEIIEAKLQEEAQGRIRVSGYVYPGTKVSIGTCMMYVKENLQHCTLYRDGADIRVGALDR